MNFGLDTYVIQRTNRGVYMVNIRLQIWRLGLESILFLFHSYELTVQAKLSSLLGL